MKTYSLWLHAENDGLKESRLILIHQFKAVLNTTLFAVKQLEKKQRKDGKIPSTAILNYEIKEDIQCES